MREVHVLNLGAGVQSTRLYLKYSYNAAIFADTGEEPQAVYRHPDWLKSLGHTRILVRSVGSRLGDDLIHGRNSIGGRFTAISTSDSVTCATTCTSRWRIRREPSPLMRAVSITGASVNSTALASPAPSCTAEGIPHLNEG